MKIIIEATSKEIAELLKEIKVQPDTNIDTIAKNIFTILQKSSASYGHTL